MTKINWKLFDSLSKCLVLMAIIGLGCNLAWVHLFSPDLAEERMKSLQNRTAEMLSTAGESGIPFADFTSGGWRFVKEDWEYKMYPDDGRFKQLPQEIRDVPSIDHESEIEIFREMGATEKDLGKGWSIWETDDAGFAQILITHFGTVQAVRVKMQSKDGMTVVENRPCVTTGQSVEPLLPIFEGVEQTATKENDQGLLVATMLKLRNAAAPNLRDFWRSHGWDVRPLVEPDLVSGFVSQSNERHRCVKDESIIDVTFIPDAEETVVVLTRFK